MTHSKMTFVAGAFAGSVITAALLTVGTAALEALRAADGGPRTDASQATATAPARYPVKIVLENARVRVRDVTFPAGVSDTGMHTHEYAHVGVILTDGQLVFTDKDGKKETASFTSG